MDCFTPDDAPDASQSSSPDLERVYFVPYRWLKEGIESCVLDENENRAILYTASSAYAGPMKIINNFFNSDLVFNLKREDDWGLSDGNEEEVSAREYALISDEMWLHSLKRHHESNAATKNSVNFSFAEDGVVDVYPLQLRLSVVREANQMTAKITKKDNVADFYKRACKIFSVESEPLRIWDFSGQTNLYFTNERNKIPKDNQRLSDQEVLLELQVYGMPDSAKCKNESKKEVSGYGGSFLSNGSMGNVDSDLAPTNPLNPIMIGNCGREGSVGLTGLQNLGNTCFMNSAIQCLAHTPQLVEYFLGDYSREINRHNPLGMDGELALAFGDLLRKLWAPGRTPIAPRVFKSKLARFAPQFSGFNQHDSQELLSFLLDGLHEDLNRVKCKPYIEAKDAHGRPDEEVADEYWANHLARNDSIIVDVCQGQYRSTLVCPICNKVSVTFDPFMYLSLPLPSTMTRTMTITVFSTDGGAQPSPYTITVPKLGKCKDLIQALSVACSLRSDESLLVAEIYSHRIIRFLEEPSDSISLIRDDDRLAAYRLQKDLDRFPLVVFMHQRMEEHYIAGKLTSSWRDFGTPLITRFSKTVNGFDINNLFQNLLTPFLRPKEDAFEDLANIGNSKLEGQLETYAAVGLDDVNPIEKSEDGSRTETSFQFYVTGDKGLTKEVTLEMYKPVPLLGSGKHLNLIVCWSEKTIQNYDVRLLSSLPEIFKSGFFAKRPQDSVSLYSCLEAFLKEEPLGPEDMWYCPSCKMHRQASKKLDLWRLPEILVIHLKRFSYSRFMKNKLETFVDFPIRDMDLSGYIVRKNGKLYNRYVLYAVSNHYGSMGGGHYTAYVHHLEENRWYDFDDSHVSPVTEDRIKSSAAYVLFYSRVGASKPDHMS